MQLSSTTKSIKTDRRSDSDFPSHLLFCLQRRAVCCKQTSSEAASERLHFLRRFAAGSFLYASKEMNINKKIISGYLLDANK
jgi:hypothetical protein